jgi:sortase A
MIISIISIIGFIGCSIALLYPFISDRWNRYRDSKLITNYNDVIKSIDKNNYDSILKEIEEYNTKLRQRSRLIVTNAEYLPDEWYESLMDMTHTGMMGYIEIPKIDITEPIYHYCTDESLKKGIGHMHGSSLPIGGNSCHTILTGHRGLPNQKFFSDLDRMEVNDRFYLHIMDEIFVYEVYDIREVYPADVDDLRIEDDKDLCTLVTCTPYGINTMRLLVMGKRVYPEEVIERDSNGNVTIEDHEVIIDPAVWIFIGFGVFIILMILVSIISNIIKKNKNRKAAVKHEKE